MKWEKIKLQKILGNLLDNLRELYVSGTVFSLPQAIDNSREVLLLQTYFTENSPWVPLNKRRTVQVKRDQAHKKHEDFFFLLSRFSSASPAFYKETETITTQAYKVSGIERGIHDRSFL